MPIGNLTSQIFANIYLNELDRFVKHELRVKNYLRYGDDFILIEPDLQKLKQMRIQTFRFLKSALGLQLNPKNDHVLKATHGLQFLGMVIYPKGRRLKRRNENRITLRLNRQNVGSYYGLVRKHGKTKNIKEFHWRIHQFL
jgi:RNA-directed DNA polymerase